MRQFITKFADRIAGVLCGFDRLVMRGELRALYIAQGGCIQRYLRNQILLLSRGVDHFP